MSDLESENLGEATPADVADVATGGDDNVEFETEESSGHQRPEASMPSDQADGVVT